MIGVSFTPNLTFRLANRTNMCSCILRNFLRMQRVLREPFNKHNGTVTYSQFKQTRLFSDNSRKIYRDEEGDAPLEKEHNLAIKINEKYKVFRDEDADVILDVTEEQERINLEDLKPRKFHDPYANIDQSRGITGVFDIDDLVALLKQDKAQQIFVASVPKEYSYVDYIVIVTGRTQRHMNALATYVRKVYKLKHHKYDLIPKIEGADSNWLAMDLGNIALHILSPSARTHYDLETLWTVGSQYDDKSNEPEEPNLMDQYNAFLKDFEPART